MKKLMIAAAIVCAAVCSNAAALNWAWAQSTAAKTIMDTTPAIVGNTTIYLFADYTSSANMKTAADGVLTSLRAGNEISGYKDSASINAAGTMNSAKTYTSSAFETTQNNYMFAVVLATDAAGNQWAAIDNLYKKGAATGGTATNFNMGGWDGDYVYAGTDQTFDENGKGWYQITAGSPTPTPEPTSGLLLLLGVAGLALKRRRV